MIRTNHKMRLTKDARGAITPGERVEKDGKVYGRGLAYFNVRKYPEIAAVYGEKPNAIFVMIPSNDLNVFLRSEYSQMGKPKDADPNKTGIRKLACDGQTCTVKLKSSICGKHFPAGKVMPCVCAQYPEYVGEDRCVCWTELTAFVVHPQTGVILLPSPVAFSTKSLDNSDQWLTELPKLLTITQGKPQGQYLRLQVQWVESIKVVGDEQTEKRNYPKLSLQLLGDIASIKRLAARNVLPVDAEQAQEAALLLSSGVNARALTAGDNKSAPQFNGKQLSFANGAGAEEMRKEKVRFREWYDLAKGNGQTALLEKIVREACGKEMKNFITLDDYQKANAACKANERVLETEAA